jgi:hypothetical protein
MGVVLEFGLVLLLLALGAGAFLRGSQRRVSSEREAVMLRRVDAYMATIRREGTNRTLTAMSDEELRDLLLSGARNLQVDSDRRFIMLTGGALVGVLAAILAATQNGLQGFGITLVVAAIVLYGVNEVMTRKSREPLLARGIDIDRLRVE